VKMLLKPRSRRVSTSAEAASPQVLKHPTDSNHGVIHDAYGLSAF